MRVSDKAFRRLVDEALALVPEEFRPYLDGVPVLVEDWPPETLLEDLGLPVDETLYGLYSGPALTEGVQVSGDLPPRITIRLVLRLADEVLVAEALEGPKALGLGLVGGILGGGCLGCGRR